MQSPARVGIIGCGKILGAYIKGCRDYQGITLAACADLDRARARAAAKEHGIPEALSVRALLARDDIDVILNLTVPQAHVKVDLAAIKAGKHVHAEKPLALDVRGGRKVMEAAQAAGLRVGSAPDTFLGGGQQTARKLIDDGAIGKPIAATAFLAGRGVETWHPNPEFYYKPGGGPMLDMGPYYLTALINLLGPAESVMGETQIAIPQRLVTSQPFAGKVIDVEVPTHYTGVVTFKSGVLATLIMSFEVTRHSLPRIEIHGVDGSLSVPDPNTFKGPVKICRTARGGEWEEVPLTHSDTIGRGAGVADLVYAVKHNRPVRASGEVAYHALEVMKAFEESAKKGKRVTLKTTCERPAAIPLGEIETALDQ